MSIFSSIGDLFSGEGKSLSQFASDITKAPSFGNFWNSFGAMDPVMHGAIDDQSKLDDRVTGAVAGEVGATGVQSYLDKEASDPTQAAMQHLLAGVAWAGGEAALGGGAGGAAGGGTAMGDSAGTLGAVDSQAASSQLGLTATDVGGTSSATAGAGSGAGAGSSAWLDYAKSAAKVIAPTVLSSLLAPKPPKAPPVEAMPDPLAQQQAQQQRILQQLARRGRASTILTSPSDGGGSLGG